MIDTSNLYKLRRHETGGDMGDLSTQHLIVLEGCHGSGKSVLGKALAEKLDVPYWKHPSPPHGASLHEAALHYANARRTMLRSDYPNTRVIVCDRWDWSSNILGMALDDYNLLDLYTFERKLEPQPFRRTILLDAELDVLKERIESRGEVWKEQFSREHAAARKLAAFCLWPIVRTDQPKEFALRELVEIAVRFL